MLFAAMLAAVVAVSCAVPGLPELSHFPLVASHRTVACADCHGATLATALPETCIGCHLDVRPQNHDTRDCGGCHQPTTWDDVVGVNHDVFLPLTGGHAPLACTDCHAPDTWEGLDAACESCHEPDRPSGHYAGACATCHNPSGWDDATFDHRPFFPVPHNGVRACASCHPEPAGTTSFTCIDCHEHNKPDTDRHHREVSRYRYTSEGCLSCHPRGDD